MRQFVLVFVLCTFFTASRASAQSVANPEISFKEAVHDFDTIRVGEIVTCSFTFTNTGTGVLKITDVISSCRCVTTEWPKEEIKPGATSVIKVNYNSGGRPPDADFQKGVRIISNASTSPTLLTVKGYAKTIEEED